MPAPENTAAIAREWMNKAENDLKNAAHTLKLGANCPADPVTLSEAKEAVKLARRVRREVRKLLENKPLF